MKTLYGSRIPKQWVISLLTSRTAALLRVLVITFLTQTALHLATHTQQTDMIKKLLIAGASPYMTDHKGNTPLHIACKFNSTRCLDEILHYTSLKNIRGVALIRNNEGLTCVHVAVRHGNTDALRKLKSMRVDLNMQVCKHQCLCFFCGFLGYSMSHQLL